MSISMKNAAKARHEASEASQVRLTDCMRILEGLETN